VAPPKHTMPHVIGRQHGDKMVPHDHRSYMTFFPWAHFPPANTLHAG